MKKFWNVIVKCFSGLYALLQDPAGIICLLALAIVSALCWFHRVGDVSFSACCTLIPAVIAMLKHKAFSGSDIDQSTIGDVVQPPPPVNPAAPPPPNPQ